jgi:3-oxoadipate enol-lactonase
VPNRHPIARLLTAAGVLAAILTLVALCGADAPLPTPKFMALGSGPTVVLVHDLGSSRMVWMPTARKLMSRGFRVVLVDLPGHGDSALPDPFTLDAAAASLGQALTASNPDSTIVVGTGMGGMLSIMALKGRPHPVRGVALIDCGLKSPLKIDDQEIQYFKQQMDASYDVILRMIYSKAGRDSIQGKAIHATAAQVPPFTIKSYLGAVLTQDASPALKALGSPYMLIGTDRLFKAHKDAKTQGLMLRDLGYEDTLQVVRRINDAGFLVMQDQPDTLAAVVSGFAGRVLAKK